MPYNPPIIPQTLEKYNPPIIPIIMGKMLTRPGKKLNRRVVDQTGPKVDQTETEVGTTGQNAINNPPIIPPNIKQIIIPLYAPHSNAQKKTRPVQK